MNDSVSTTVSWLLRAGAFLFAANEIRGLILAGPVLYAMYEAGGTAMSIWLGFCSISGVVLSVIVPIKLKHRIDAWISAKRGGRRVVSNEA